MLFNSFNFKRKTATWLPLFMVLVAVFVFLPHLASAQSSLGIELAQGTGLGTRDLRELIVLIIRILLGFLGIIAVILIIYAGYLWLTSQGEEQKIEQAKKILVNAVIGLAIILSAYGIVIFVVNKFNLNGGANNPIPGRDSGFDVGGGGGALGGGILRDVYPDPGAKDVARNTLIMVSFKEVMDVNTLIDTGNAPQGCQGVPAGTTCGAIKDSEGLAIVITNEDDSSVLGADQVAIMTRDNKNFVLNPEPLLGNANADSAYSVNLTDSLAKAGGARAFLTGGYTWHFTVSNFSDLTPPKVESVAPTANQEVKRNVTIQIDFNEAVSAAAVLGSTTGNPEEPLNTILISYPGDQNNTVYLRGETSISNRFRTVEFSSAEVCDVNGQPVQQNSCGVRPTCFPADKVITALLKAAQVNNNGETVDIFSGITDAAGNSLDGNKDGMPEGQPNDNFSWNFNTTNDLDLTPPRISSVAPEKNANGVPNNSRVRAQFNELMMSSTLTSENFRIFKYACDGANFPANVTCYPAGGFSISKENGEAGTSAILRTFSPYLDPLTIYNPRLTAGIKDLYQNCFNPAVGP